MSSGLSGKVASEFGGNPATPSLSTRYLPQVTLVCHQGSLLFLAWCTEAHPLARENCFVSCINTFSVKKSCVLPLVLALDHSLPDIRVGLEVLFPAGSTGSRVVGRALVCITVFCLFVYLSIFPVDV